RPPPHCDRNARTRISLCTQRDDSRAAAGGDSTARSPTLKPMQEVLSVSNDVAAELAGVGDGVLDALRDRLDCTILLRGNRLTIEGSDPDVAQARAVIAAPGAHV